MNADALRLDGNSIGGLLGEIFAFDVSNAETICAGCGARRPVGALMVYRHAMGVVVRCSHCDNVLMHVGTLGGRYCLNLSGMSAFELKTEIH